MKPENSAASWLSFFTAAGIPKEPAENYAVTFSKNQIELDMLPDIKKEDLKDMGIYLMGHIIGILRHAKTVHADHLKKIELSTPQNKSSSSATPRNSKSSKDNNTVVNNINTVDVSKQAANLKRKKTVVQLKQNEEPKNKVRKKLCDSSDDVFTVAVPPISTKLPSNNAANVDNNPEECKKGVFKRLGGEVLTPEPSNTSVSVESVFSRLGSKSLTEKLKEVNSLRKNDMVKRIVASKEISKPSVKKSIIKTRDNNKPQRILVSPSYMDAVIKERGIVSPTYIDRTCTEKGVLISPTYMDGAREERDLQSRLNYHKLLDKKNIKSRLGNTSSQQLNGSNSPVKKVSFGCVYRKLIPLVKKPALRNSPLNIDFSSQKGSIGLSTGVFSRLGKNFY